MCKHSIGKLDDFLTIPNIYFIQNIYSNLTQVLSTVIQVVLVVLYSHCNPEIDKNKTNEPYRRLLSVIGI